VSRPKRHHYVPRNYLERFADGSRILVRRRDGASFPTNCINVAVESGFYDVDLPGAPERMAYGFRSGANYTARVLVFCSGHPPGLSPA